jgi:serine/threonine-protein kinase
LVIEYVDGDSLSRVLRSVAKRGTTLPLPFVGSIVSQMLYGLHAVHETKGEDGRPLGLVHRDVSPDNVLIGRDGSARLLDFGIAKATEHGRRTQAGRVKGKIAYMAPEHLRGQDPDRRLDVYAVGAVLWEALTGRRLHENGTDAELVYRVLHSTLAPPSSIVPSLGKDVDELVMKALDPVRENRFATAKDMAVAVEHVLGVTSPASVGRLVEGMLAKELETRAEMVASAMRRTAELKSGDIPIAPNLLVTTPSEPRAAAGKGVQPGPFASPKGSAKDSSAAAHAGTEILLGDLPGPAKVEAPMMDLPALDIPGAPSPTPAPAPTATSAAAPSSGAGAALGDLDLAQAPAPAPAHAAAPPGPVETGEPTEPSGLGGMEVDFGRSQQHQQHRPATPSAGSHAARPPSQHSPGPGSEPASNPGTGGHQVTRNAFVAAPAAAAPTGGRSLLLPLALAGVVFVGALLYFALGSSKGTATPAPSAAPPAGVDAQRSCEVLRRRARNGNPVTGLTRDGWVVELWLRGRAGAPIDASVVDVTALKGPDPESYAQLAKLSAMNRPTDEGMIVRMWGKVAADAFEPDGAARLVKAADQAFDRSKADVGALYLKCSHLQYHDVGLWFRGRDAPGAATSLLFTMAAFSDTRILKDGVLDGPHASNKATAYEQLSERVMAKPLDGFEAQLQRYGGTAQKMDAGSIRITFPPDRANDSIKASRIVADHAGIEEL